MQQVWLCKGIPASGKSTFAKEHVKKHPGDWKRINRDELRLLLDVGQYSPKNERFIVETRNNLLVSALRKGYSVIIDDTNLRDENWKDICNIVERENRDVLVMEKCFPIDVDEAITRDKTRGASSVGETVIRGMWKKNVKGKPDVFQPRIKHYSAKQVPSLRQDPNLPKAVICDLDGTLAVIGDRSPYDASQCDVLDAPNTPVVETVRLFHEAGYTVLFVSGREDKDRDATMRFIAKHLPEVCCEWFHTQVNQLTSTYQLSAPEDVEGRKALELDLEKVTELMTAKIAVGSAGSILLMRATGDQRKDTIVKREVWDQHIDGRYNVLCAIDDRPSVCRCWRYEVGIPVFQVADKEF